MLAFTRSRTLTAVKDAALERNLRVWRLISSGMLLLRTPSLSFSVLIIFILKKLFISAAV